MKKKILFVDDEINVLDGLRRLLRGYQEIWELYFAASVNEALQKIGEVDFDVIVSDISMPGKDGFDLLEALQGRERTRDIPVIILTGMDVKSARNSSLKRRALDVGAADLLNKPVERDELFARLRSAIRLKSLQDKVKTQGGELEKMVRERTRDLAESRLDFILRLVRLAERQGSAAESHGLKVGCYSRVISEALGMDRAFTERLALAGVLHDIGKIVIPEEVLWKKEALSHDEREFVKRHCAIGHAILVQNAAGAGLFRSLSGGLYETGYDPGKNPVLKTASVIALTHHEWWNGKGYPNCLAGEDIPLESRIVALAEVFDELTSYRPYKETRSANEALLLIEGMRGAQFDREACEAMRKTFPKLRDLQRQFAALERAPEGLA